MNDTKSPPPTFDTFINGRMAELQAEYGDRIIPVRMRMARFLGSINAAVFLQQLMFQTRDDHDMWYWHTADQIKRETTLSAKQQRSIRLALVEKGLLQEVLRGVPARLYYQVQWRAIAEQMSDDETGKLDAQKGNIKLGTNGTTRCDTTAQHTSVNNESNNESINPPTPQGGTDVERDEIYPDDFLTFWQAYPNKTGKQAALKWWQKHKPGAARLQTILAAIETQRHSDKWIKDHGQYIPNPATWLNQGRWDDEAIVTVTPAAKSYDINDYGPSEWAGLAYGPCRTPEEQELSRQAMMRVMG